LRVHDRDLVTARLDGFAGADEAADAGAAQVLELAEVEHEATMQPSEYLTVDESNNLSQISDGAVHTVSSYRRLRIDPVTLAVVLSGVLAVFVRAHRSA
jgi:hypothetical protein